MMELSLVRGVIKAGQATTEIAAQHDISQLETRPAIDAQIESLIRIGAAAHRQAIRSVGIFIRALRQGLAGELSVVEEADIRTCADKEAVLLIPGKRQLIGKVERNVDIIQVEGLF